MRNKSVRVVFVVILVCIVLFAFSGCSIFHENSGAADENANHVGESGEIITIDVKNESKLLVNNIKKVTALDSPVLKTSFRDDEYYYYLFDLGMINNVPLENFSNMIRHENHGQKTTHIIESASVETSTISRTLSETTQNTIETSTSASVKLASEIGAKEICSVSAEYAYSVSAGMAVSKSYIETYADASSFSKTKKISVSMQFDEDTDPGYYGYILTGAVEVYAIVAYDIEKKEYIVDYFSDILQYWIDLYYFSSSDEFVNYNFDVIDFSIPNNLDIPTAYKDLSEKEYLPVAVTMNRYNCNDGNQYNKYEQEESADWRSRHNGFELGELMIYGCSKIGNVYSVGDRDKFSIKYHVLQDTSNLPRVGTQLTKINNDSETKVTGTNINGRINYGAYWVRITYLDHTQAQYNATNILSNANANTYVELVNKSQINGDKEIAQIEVVIVYEMYAGAPGFMGIWWHEYTNWRCEYSYSFI